MAHPPKLIRSVLLIALLICLSSAAPLAAQNEPDLWWQHTAALAETDVENGNYSEAVKKYDSIVQDLAKVDRDNLEIVYPLIKLANALTLLNRRTDAENAGKRAIEITEVNPPHTATMTKQGYSAAQLLSTRTKLQRFALEGLAGTYLGEERYSEAEKLLTRSIAKFGTGEDSVTSQSLLGDVYRLERDYKRAADSYKKTIAIREKLKDPVELAKAYKDLGNLYYHRDDYVLAETNLVKAIEIMRKANLTTTPVSAELHDFLGNIYYYEKRMPDAEKEYRAAVENVNNNKDASESLRASYLRDLGSALVSQGRFAEAEQCYNTAFKGSNYTAYQNVFLDNLYLLQRKICNSNYKRLFTATDIHQCIVGNQKKLAPNSLAYAKFLEDIVISYQAFPVRNEAAIPLLQQALAIRKQLEGPLSPQIAHDQYLLAYRLAILGGEFEGPAIDSYKSWKQLNKLGSTKLKAWQFAEVRLAYLLGALGAKYRSETLEIADAAYDTESKSGLELFDLATLYELLGKFGKARVIYDEAFEFAKAQKNLSNMAIAALSRAELSFRERDFTNAWTEVKQAEALFKEEQGPEYYKNDPRNLSCVQLLTDLSVERGELPAAEGYARILVGPIKWRAPRVQIERHFLVLAKILLLEGRTEEAKKIANNSVTSLANQVDGNYVGEIELAHAHDMLGDIALASKDYKDADLHYRRAFNLYRDDDESTSGILGMVNDLNQIARCLSVSGGRSALSVHTACAKLENYLKSVFPQISFAQQCAFVTCIGDQIDPLLTYASTSESAPKTFQYLMRWQGLLVDSVRRSSGEMSGNADSVSQLQKIRNQLSQLSTQSHSSESVSALTTEKESIERKLAMNRKYDDASDAVLKKTSTDFTNALAADEVFIDIVHYHKFDTGSPAYAAFIATKNGAVKVVNFSDADQIDGAIDKWLQSMAAPGGSVRDLQLDPQQTGTKSTESPDALSTIVSNKLWAPLKAAIPNTAKKIWLCPDSKLSTLPWSVLLENAHSDNLLLTQIDSPRAFLSLKQSASNVALDGKKKVLLVGGINFANKSLFLPGTKEEVAEIKGLAKEQGLQLTELTGSAATKSALLQSLSKATFAHIATHGFFNQTQSSSTSTPKSSSASLPKAKKSLSREIMSASGDSTDNTFLMERDPLLSSGLLVAPAVVEKSSDITHGPGTNSTDSASSSSADDHLTAEELVGQDLSGCRTVVLSACNSGRGKGYDGQGVMGLRAALVGAGAHGVVMSLWPVDDEATRELMKQFYVNLWSKTNPMPPTLALRTAQQAVRNSPSGQWKHPFYWAGWIFDGVGW